MKVLLIGGGGREHALARALARDEEVTELHAVPGNPGIGSLATLHDGDVLDGTAMADLATELGVDLVVVGPEAPLVAGVADALRNKGFACFGPGAAAARIEGSKAFAKEIMAAADIPTAMARICDTAEEVETALDAFGPPYIVKDDALAAGKGVVVTRDREVARAHAAACSRVVIEEFLDGPEVSVFAICDGVSVMPLMAAQDFKRLRDGDEGPNTGGMGAYAPLDWLPGGFVDEVVGSVVQPCVDELHRRGSPFIGLLYAGLALTERGVQVVEFNARFGDPETQPLLELLQTSLAGVLMAAAKGRLDLVDELRWRDGAAVAVVMSAEGYPESPRKGDVIRGADAADALDGVVVLQAGTALSADGELVTSGGRVLAVTATGVTVEEARRKAYAGVEQISFDGAHHRTDIGRLPSTGG
jgi:phosphoribosylamine---glycine ligase